MQVRMRIKEWVEVPCSVAKRSCESRVSDSRIAPLQSRVSYAVDGSLMNPLEAFYAVLASCAAFYAKKECQSMGIPAAGIRIGCKPFAGHGGPLSLSRFRTEVSFPENFSAEQRERVLQAISECAVKKIVQAGAEVAFSVSETAATAAAA